MRKLTIISFAMLVGACAELSLLASGSADAASREKASAADEGDRSDEPGIAAGTLTAGAWDDNLNFDYFLEYLAAEEQGGQEGLPSVPRDDRLVVQVTDAQDQPVPGADVVVEQGRSSLRTVTGAEGRALVFPSWDGMADQPLRVLARSGDAVVEREVPAGVAEVALELSVVAPAVTALDVALVLDTTGSMGDELEYLKVEIEAISVRVSKLYPDVAQRWALVLYRDEGDEYVVRSFQFTDPRSFATLLSAQAAGGGGDYPEALDQGLEAAMKLGWQGGATARIAFLVADAPHHTGREGRLLDAVRSARGQGVHVYPIASSGVNGLTEYALRTVAQATGGRYLFLTDDSGVGASHREPTLPCYFVTRLDAAMLRMIDVEISGRYREPTASEVLRTGGDPEDRRCELANGQVVVAY